MVRLPSLRSPSRRSPDSSDGRCVIRASGVTPNDFIVAFVTSNVASARFTFAVLVEPPHLDWRLTGLKSRSVFRADKLVTSSDRVIGAAIGRLPEDVPAGVRFKLKHLLQKP